MRTRTFFVAGLLLALLVAGVGSFYASAHPDGLNAVAQQTGFGDREQRSAAADGPFAGYSTKGVDNPRLSGGLAGVVGCLLVLVIAGGVAYAVRRRGTAESAEHEPAAPTDPGSA